MKDPAFLFYPNDWLGGTMGMTFEEKGAYMELLMMQFNRGHMTIHMIAQTVGQLWDKIKDKFRIDENGLYYNERLELEQNKRKAFTDSRRNNVSGKNQHTKKEGHKEAHMTSHMENENINENSIVFEKGVKGEKQDLIDPKISSLCDKVMKYWCFNELAHFNHLREINTFLNVLSGSDRLVHFSEQFDFYQKQREYARIGKHNIRNFIGTPENKFEDGAWNAENWKAKYDEVVFKSQKQDPPPQKGKVVKEAI